MTIDLTASVLSDILEGLDNAIECMADWSDDELNTARDRPDIRQKTRKFWRLVKKLSSTRQTITGRFRLREPVAALERPLLSMGRSWVTTERNP
jgi:hypothetical protein